MYRYSIRTRDLFKDLPEHLSWLIAVFMLINVFGGFYYIKKDLLIGLIYVIAVLIGFIFHELGHRMVSRKLGCSARFTIDLFSVIVTGFIGVIQNLYLLLHATSLPLIFALPGYVLSICSFSTLGFEGAISSAGPSVNIMISIATFIMMKIFPEYSLFLKIISEVNIILALFNLIPIPPLDGYKIIRWNLIIWLLLVTISLIILMSIR